MLPIWIEVVGLMLSGLGLSGMTGTLTVATEGEGTDVMIRKDRDACQNTLRHVSLASTVPIHN